jgi:Insertion element 4 transposase N-terminal
VRRCEPESILPRQADSQEPNVASRLVPTPNGIPRARIDAVLAATERASCRQRDLPAHVVVYYVIALALYMQSSYREVLYCVVEGLQWLLGPAAVRVAGKVSRKRARASDRGR